MNSDIQLSTIRTGSNKKPQEPPPFKQHLLKKTNAQEHEDLQVSEDDLTSLLPASRRTEHDDLTAYISASPGFTCNEDGVHQLTKILDEELNLDRLTRIHDWLWIAGRPRPPHPLHEHCMISRKIIITEKLDLHLVWDTGYIFIKPLSRFLLEPCFWKEFLSCDNLGTRCNCKDLRERALGFLNSYAALITYESDFHIAKEMRLIPEEVDWMVWRIAVRELMNSSPMYNSIDRRFLYGELRLSRLDKIYFFWETPLQGYMTHWYQYSTFFRDNFALLASSTVLVALVLTAMQVGLATEALQSDSAFQSASYGFTVFSILGPLAAVGLFLVVFCCVFIGNWATARSYQRKRMKHIEEQ
ncbi:hypothetical protein ACHAP8_009910 [Fusarium lateritium]